MAANSDENTPLNKLEEHFLQIRDRTKDHNLLDIISIAICAIISGAEGWVDMENYGKSKTDWLKTFLELANGIPSHDTFGRVFSQLGRKHPAEYEWSEADELNLAYAVSVHKAQG
jgi:hypothetical protein